MIILLDNEHPAGDLGIRNAGFFIDPATGRVVAKDVTGFFRTQGGQLRTLSLAAQVLAAVDVYLAGSNLPVPAHGLQVGTAFRWRIVVTKTAGTGTIVVTVRIGTTGLIGDAAILTFTLGTAGTGVTDQAVFDINAILRNVGATGILAGSLFASHNLAITGFFQTGTDIKSVTSAGFVTTTAGLIAGVSFNGSTAFSGSCELVDSEMMNI